MLCHRSSPYTAAIGAPRPSSPIQSVPPPLRCSATLVADPHPVRAAEPDRCSATSVTDPVPIGAGVRCSRPRREDPVRISPPVIAVLPRRRASRFRPCRRPGSRITVTHVSPLEINENPTTLVRLQDGTAFIGRVHLSAAKIPRLPQDLESCTSHRLPTAHPAGSPVRLTAPKALHE